MKGSAADILVKYLENEGIEYVFGVPGGHLLPLYDAIQRSGNIKPILTKHEAGAAFMAYGYAVTSGKIGVCCGTVGPGATNLVTGVASAYMDSVPMLVLTAQVGTTTIGKGALQEGAGVGRTVNQVGLFEKIAKMSMMEVRGTKLPHTIQRALRIALSGRQGPVHIDLPADVQGESIEADIPRISSYRPIINEAIDLENIRLMANCLLDASKPVILAGFGLAFGDRDADLVQLAERLQIPVATTLRAKGVFPEDHPLALGCVGLYGTKAANTYLRSKVDVFLALGTSFHEFTTHCWDPAFIPSKSLLQIDVDPEEIGKNYPVTNSIVGDSHVALKALLAATEGQQRSGEDILAFKHDKGYFQEESMDSDEVPIKPQRLMNDIASILPREAVIFADIGNTVTWAERYLQCYPEGRFVTLTGLAAMGSATAAVIGGKLGKPQSPAICLCGDGDFLMTGMEVSTAVNHAIPVIWVILRNSRLGMIHDVQSVSYKSRYIATTFSHTDFAALSQALGGQGYRVEKPEDIKGVLTEALQTGKPTAIEVIIDENEMPPIKPRMLALRRSLGFPDPMKSVSWDGIKTLWKMTKER